jgi:hypothetical protein
MSSAQGTPRPGRAPNSAAAIFLQQSTTINFPVWWKRAKVTLQDGGYSSSTSVGSSSVAGPGGDAGISWIDIVPGIPYIVNVGSGGIGPAGPTNLPQVAGGLSSIQAKNQPALTTANSLIKIPGGKAATNSQQTGCGSLLSQPGTVAQNYGGGAAPSSANANGNNGAPGCVLIEYVG